MKEKTSITLSSDLLAQIDRSIDSKASRSAFIEQILRAYFSDMTRKAIHLRDLERINSAASRLNAEVKDVLEYQALEQ